MFAPPGMGHDGPPFPPFDGGMMGGGGGGMGQMAGIMGMSGGMQPPPFAHGRQHEGSMMVPQRREPPPSERISYFKTQICKSWMRGACDLGDQCRYAHGEGELRQWQGGARRDGGGPVPRRPPPFDGPPPPFDGPPPFFDGPPPPMIDPFFDAPGPPGRRDRDFNRGDTGARWQRPYKEGVCYDFMKHGTCNYGERCKYAHFRDELRPEEQHLWDRAKERYSAPPQPIGGAPAAAMRPPMQPPRWPQPGAAQDGDVAMKTHASAASPSDKPPSFMPHAARATGLARAASGGPTPDDVARVSLVDRVRAVCAMVKIGDAMPLIDKPAAAFHAAVTAIQDGSALRESPFADGVEDIVFG